MNKREILKSKSDPIIVMANAKSLLGPDTKLYISTHKNKKYMVQNPDGKFIHFGDINSEDFTYHQDRERRQRFLTRNAKWRTADKWTPAWLALNLLW